MKYFLKIFNIKNIIAILLTIILGILLIKNGINQSLIAIFAASYGSVLTYFFADKRKDNYDE